ncbi:hypothetical protein ANN_13262 [Periplaneta americana]|uniref:Uncharacterized protein n=1 Tax=Periplaneta americana TaxID=6978 RepID=A0ABQ8TME6_PERAM|nr:hypothetical protein ANN_13262 [Periplaneta americana]
MDYNTVEGKPRKNLNQVTCPDRKSNPGHLVSRPDALTVTPQTSKWADNRQATNFECTLTPCDLNCGFLLTNSDVYYANQDFQLWRREKGVFVSKSTVRHREGFFLMRMNVISKHYPK